MARKPRKQEPKQQEAPSPPDPVAVERVDYAVPSIGAVAAALAGMAAAWVAAGSLGAVCYALGHSLVWAMLAIVLVVGWPREGRSWRNWLVLIGSAAAAVVLTVPTADFYNVLAVAVVLAAVAWNARGVDRRLLSLVAAAVTLFGVYRFAVAAIPTVWTLADGCGYLLGQVAGTVFQKPLWLGGSFGGVDFLVLMAAVLAGWLASTRSPRAARAVWAVAGILAAQFAYLGVLAYAVQLHGWLPPAPPVASADMYMPPPWSWSDAARSLVPWSIPIVAGLLQLVVASAMFRWARWSPVADSPTTEPATKLARVFGPLPKPVVVASLVLAAIVGPLGTFWLGRSSLEGKKIVAFGEGYLDWNKPVYDRYGQAAAGMYGMLPTFVSSLGGTFEISDSLAPETLAAADLLMLIHPTKPWPEEQVEQVWDYVRSGGSLLIVGEPRVNEAGKTSAFDEVLAPGRLGVRYDVVVPRSSQWQQSMLPSMHPVGVGGDDRRGRFGMVNASSIDVRWPASPVLVGRWGWSEPGSDSLLTNVYRFEEGEKLGDLVLAAEQSFGDGRVFVLGDAVPFTNVGSVDSYPFTGRLLAYLAGGWGSPHAGWRQMLALAACLALAVLLVWFRQPAQLAAAALLLAITVSGTTALVRWQSVVLPDTSKSSPATSIVCIDGSHVGAFNDFTWTNEGLAGLELTLMRGGYLPLLLPEISRERLAAADLLITIGPARRYSRSEREAIDEFVRGGGIFIVMAGAEHSRAINEVLADYGFRIPVSPLPVGDPGEEPRPMGNFRTPFTDAGDYRPHVLLYAGWPIVCPETAEAEVLVHGFDGLPVAGSCQVGQGKVVVIGDTQFAMNKNLEYTGGEPFDGGYENANFWRWLLARLNGEPDWTPPKPLSGAALEAALKDGDETAAEENTTTSRGQTESHSNNEESPR